MSEATHEIGYAHCFCGRRAVIRTSWTKQNPGRRFQSCLNYERGGCRYFDWEDPPMCPRSRIIIPGLLKKLNALDDANKKLQADIMILKEGNKKLAMVIRLLIVVMIPVFCGSVWWISSTKSSGSRCFEELGMKMIG
ncbi:hypothetical protein DH2020_016457 [Rehmannia glutinosa]|uniref:GRF-type domain-containing protein n=1 Tax=Rehmannia glutinosa TaxID=99300 RepID=A0ABR0WRH2_REHGL